MKAFRFERHPENPIVRPGGLPWRRAVVFNPGAVAHAGKVYLLERAAGGLRPFHCCLGLLESADGVHFRHADDEPVLTPADCGSPHGSVQDPRIVAMEDRFYLTFAFRPYAWASHPTGVGVPESRQVDYPGFSGRDEDNQTRSGIAVSEDLRHWEILGWVNPPEVDDRNVILFPEKVGGRYAVLRRPSPLVSTGAQHRGAPSIRISFSEDLKTWSEPEVVLKPEFRWENNRIGGSTPPLRTEAGWLVLYHGVETEESADRRVCYRVGAALLDLEDPRRVVARCPHFIMEPEAYYERTGLYIPNVIFPTGLVVRDGVVHLYYGVCDTAIALATAPLDALLGHVLDHRV